MLILALPSGFVVESAGPTLNVNGKVDSKQVVSVTDVPHYPSDSRMFLTTVSSWGGPDGGVPVGQALAALVDPRSQLFPVQAIYPEHTTSEQEEKKDQQAMQYSQDSAAAVAMSKAGYEVTQTLTVVSLDSAYPASSHLREGDVILGLRRSGEQNFTPMHNFLDVSLFTVNLQHGDVIDAQISRDGEEHVVTFPVVGAQADSTGWVKPGALIGAGVEVSDLHLPATVEYAINDIGGPSAGTMFMLGIYDQLTEGSLAGTANIAGTGTMAWNGEVGAIGGIVHKMEGAAKSGATDFLAPAENCAETVGYEPAGMRIWAIRSADEAIAAATAIGSGNTSSLIACSAVVSSIPR